MAIRTQSSAAPSAASIWSTVVNRWALKKNTNCQRTPGIRLWGVLVFSRAHAEEFTDRIEGLGVGVNDSEEVYVREVICTRKQSLRNVTGNQVAVRNQVGRGRRRDGPVGSTEAA